MGERSQTERGSRDVLAAADSAAEVLNAMSSSSDEDELIGKRLVATDTSAADEDSGDCGREEIEFPVAVR